MKTWCRALLIAGLFLAGAAGAARACYCGALRLRCTKQAACCRAECTCCQQCCIVMKTCQEVVYEPKEVIAHKTVYEEVVEKVKLPTVKYVPQTDYRYVCSTVMQPQAPEVCEPARGCAAAATCQPCEPCRPCKMAPVPCIRKVPYQTFKPVPDEKVVERKRIVTKQVPYKVTCYEPRVICKRVPVEVCCPVPCCGSVRDPAPCDCGGG